MPRHWVVGDSSPKRRVLGAEPHLCVLILGRFLALPSKKVSWEAEDASHGVYSQQEEK